MTLTSLPSSKLLHRLLWAVLVCFVLGTLAQAGHLHTARTAHTHEQCELCVSFGGLMAAPDAPASIAHAAPTDEPLLIGADVVDSLSPMVLPPARAPPAVSR